MTGLDSRASSRMTAGRWLPLFLWIPVTPVITADGCNDWGGENDGAGQRSFVVNESGQVRTAYSSGFPPSLILTAAGVARMTARDSAASS